MEEIYEKVRYFTIFAQEHSFSAPRTTKASESAQDPGAFHI